MVEEENVKQGTKMKLGLIFMGIVMVLLIIFFSIPMIIVYSSSIHVFMYDTLFVVSHLFLITFCVLVLGSFFFLGASIGTRFKDRYFWLFLLLFLAIDLYFIVDYIIIFST